MPITVNEYRFTRFFAAAAVDASAACAAGAAAAPATATPAPVTADFFRNFRRFNGMSASPGGTVNNARRYVRHTYGRA
ncbi:hypothetical protein STVIR_6570 [Streptomyces viridochromogenes Tue57]|uniref:Secreted protein n=1 Tax=Streptomyces viridochromogenes Tue57 TaxID=1160705 RepID=L8P8D6_STRVR|nr:hypothetical protein STVIR_6570 [Streptomyces viridochromogenes Tue57]